MGVLAHSDVSPGCPDELFKHNETAEVLPEPSTCIFGRILPYERVLDLLACGPGLSAGFKPCDHVFAGFFLPVCCSLITSFQSCVLTLRGSGSSTLLSRPFSARPAVFHIYLSLEISFFMARRKNKRKSSPKGRGRVTRKTNRAPNPLSTGGSVVTRVPGSGFDSDAERVRLRFVDILHITASAASGQYVTQVYGVNTPRQPDQSGMTGEAQGFTEMAAKYNKYVTFSSRIRWIMQELPGGAAINSVQSVAAALYPGSAGAGAVSSLADATVQKYSRRHDFPYRGAAGALPMANDFNQWLGSHFMSVQKIEGEPNLRQAGFESATSTNPTVIPVWVFAFQDQLADTTAKPSFLFNVFLEYDVLFFERKIQTNALVTKLRRVIAPVPCESVERKEAPVPDGYVLVRRVAQ